VASDLYTQTVEKYKKIYKKYLEEEKFSGRFADLLFEIGNGDYPSVNEMITIPEN
jgi:hypothetical protein